MDRQSIIAAKLPAGATVGVQGAKVGALLRDSSMRVLEAGLAFGALATALLLGLGR